MARPALAADPACAAIAWPDAVADQPRRATDPDDPALSAWGDPAIIARCGLEAPPPTTTDCLRVDDVDWLVQELSDGAAFTTYGRQPAIEVLIPDAYAPEPRWLPDLAAAAATLPHTGHSCE
ncbi:MAG: DUF3515 family protein [Tetrasphaera sp.]